MYIHRAARLIASTLFAFATLLSGTSALAQQVTYYDFDTAPANSSYACSPTSASKLFCLNDGTGNGANPSFLSDTYPAIIDPVTTDNPTTSSTHTAVQMTPAAGNQSSSMWFSLPQKISDGFTAYFAFKITPGSRADGLAFVIQNSAGGGTVNASDGATVCSTQGSGITAVGVVGAGGCMGYGGIDNSLALEFDTYTNGFGDPNNNHIALQNCGAGLPNSPDHTQCQVQLGVGANKVPAIAIPPNIDLADGNVHQVVVEYSGPNDTVPNQLQVFIDPTFVAGTHTPSTAPILSGTYDISANLNLMNSGTANDSAYIGFTAATGAAFEQHEIMAWTFTPHTPSTQQQPLNPPGTPTTFPFGAHTFTVNYPAGATTTGIDMIVTANTITPAFFAQLSVGRPYAGTQCQVYDETGGNCIVYSSSCVTHGTTNVVTCPAITDPATFIDLKSAYNNSLPPTTPGFLQGDPLYSLLTSVTGDGTTAKVSCAAECSVTVGQTITIGGTSVGNTPGSPFDGTFTVTSIPTEPTGFTFSSTANAMATGGYVASNNVQNIFTSYVPQRIDGTTAGKTKNFSDFVATSATVISPTILTDTPNPSVVGVPVTLSFKVSGVTVPTGAYTVTSSVVGDPGCSGSLVAGAGVCVLTFGTPGGRTLTLSYAGDSNYGNSFTTVLQLVSAGPLATVSTNALNFGTVYLGSINVKSVTLTNTGSAAMTITQNFLQIVGGGNSKEFVALSLCPASLAVGKSCTIFVSFIAGPTYTPQTATLMITDSAPGSPQLVSLSATVINPQGTFRPGEVEFGSVKVGTSSRLSTVLTNTGATPLAITSIGVSGASAGDFRLTSNGCPSSLAAGSSCALAVTFTPSGKGYRTANLVVVDNAKGGSQQAQLEGAGK